ncbi:MAG: hypothetical protein JSW58_00635, partial [Candidatus Latescibacterota bacterium]
MKRILVLLLVCLLVSCGKKEEKEKAPPPTTAVWLEEALDLDKAIVRTPPKIVSTTAKIDVEFRDPVVPSHLEGSVLDQNPFVFEPPIEGHAKWLSPRILRFVPDDRLPAGQRISGTLYGKIAFGEQKNVNDFRFSFKVAEQEVLRLDSDFVATPEVENGMTYTGTIAFAQPVELDKIRGSLVFEGPRGKIKLDVIQGEKPDKIQFSSEVIVRTTTGQNFTMSLPGRYTADGEKWEQSVFLAGVGEFKVVAHMDMTPPGAEEPTYGFRFSDPVKDDLDLSGYITVEPEIDYEMRVDGKYLFLQGDFYPGRSYNITIAAGFPSVYGAKRATEFRTAFSLGNIKPEVQWLSRGIYLPTDNNYRLQFKSVNIAKVRVTVTEVFPQNIGFFIQRNALYDQTSGPQRGRYGHFTYQDLNRVGEQIFSEYVEITEDWNKWVKTELDLSPVFNDRRNSVFVVELRFTIDDLVGRCVNAQAELEEGDLYYESTNYYDDPCQPGYYYQKGHHSKMLISSNIGLTVKKAENGLHVFAADVLTARPVLGLELGLYTYQNKHVESQTTDGAGYASFTEKGSYLFGRHSSGIALINDRHPSWQLNNFDVGGSAGGKRGIDVFMYTDRGVHRPGDTVHLSAIIRFDRAVPPERQPVTLDVKNPLGQTVHQAKANCGFNGHVYFPIVTDLSDPTGTWYAKLKIGDEEFSKALKIETVKPNRLKVDVDIPDAIRPPHLTLKGTVTCKYLFGAPGADLKCNINLVLGGRRFTADDFRDFIFETPLKRFESRTLPLFDGKLDSQGMREFEFRLPQLTNAPGIVQGTLKTTVFEKGGNPVSRTDVTTIYPFSAYAGIKDVFEWGSARVGENFNVPLVVVDDKGKPVEGHKIKVAVYVNRHHWWWHSDRRDQKDFRKMESTYLIGEYTYVSKTTPIAHPLAVEDYGRHLIEVTDVTSGHETGLFFSASQWGRPAPTEEKERNFLQIVSDKNVYNIGDQATLTFDTPSEGMALFTVEQGEKVLHREWKPVDTGQTSFSFSLTEEMIPNCYAAISLIQPHNQNTNDLPMRLYGVKTLYVEDQSTHLPMELAAPDELRPKQTFTIDVTSHATERATYTIAIVDDGLLDLTGFETPSAWDHFFQKIRLGVITRDNYDDIIGILFPDIDRYFSIGGGEMFAAEREKRLDRSRVKRFKPVVLFKKPIAIDPGETEKIQFEMPNYVGSVRVMVVGASGHSYSTLEKTVPVKQELMILPTLPRVARPGDAFSLPVSVFATDSTIRKVDLSLALSANLRAEGPATASLPFDKPGEKDTAFWVSVGDAIGADTA